MGWQDRGYSEGREEMKAYFANPLGLMQYALPIYKSAELQVRLAFWFLLGALFMAIDLLRIGKPEYIPLDLGLLLAVCLMHEWGHRIFARMVGGNHWEWVLWPLGGMVAPTAPRTAKAVFVANVGGIVFNVLIMAALVGFIWAAGGVLQEGASGFAPVGVLIKQVAFSAPVVHGMGTVMMLCSAMIMFNLFPCYWFDGGHLWQSVLWPFFGQWKAGLITVWAGMILAAPLFLFSLMAKDLMGMVMWALVFADCFRRRQMLKAAGESGMMEEEESSYNYMDTPEPKVRKKRKKNWVSRARKRALADQAEQARIDAILAKVKEKGLHSLSWLEKRTLKKATERQRERDLANRL